MELQNTVLGIELGSTRIKAVLLDERHHPIAVGSYEWENQLKDGIWTYSLDDARIGLQSCYASLARDVEARYQKKLETVGAIGISGMMHGYLPFGRDGCQLAEFRTWRNTVTGEAAKILSDRFHFNIPQRWSIAHLYQAVLNGEEHLEKVDYLTTLSGYIHWKLTGSRVLGVGDASGMFPIDSRTSGYNGEMAETFDALIREKGYPWRLRDILPEVLPAGAFAGRLTEAGARFLDPSGLLRVGIPFVPPEGDAGTGMAATNAVRANTGNVSAGTSDFAMLVVDRELRQYRQIDMVTTPAGAPVAMVHCNNCTSDINAWVGLFAEVLEKFGHPVEKSSLYTKLFEAAMEGEPDCGGLLSYNYLSGEGITDLDEGRPIFARLPGSAMTLGNFMRTHLFSALATLRLGLDILTQKEQVKITRICGHGGFFKTPEIGQRFLSAVVNAPVRVLETAGEGGAYGMALLAAYGIWRENGVSLEDYLDEKVFACVDSTTLMATEVEIAGFAEFLKRYEAALPVEIAAVGTMR